MNKLTNILLVLLLIAVIFLGGAVFLLWQKDSTPTIPVSSQSATSQSSTSHAAQSGTGPAQNTDQAAELSCSVQLGALRIVQGEEFALQDGNESDCQISCENGIYTVSVNTTRSAPVVVSVPKDAFFQQATFTTWGGALTAENLAVRDLHTTCEKGAIQFSGRVEGTIELDHQQGATTLQLEGNQADFNYQVSYQLGHVQIGDQTFAGVKGSHSIDNGSGKTIHANCAMGSVRVLFSQA